MPSWPRPPTLGRGDVCPAWSGSAGRPPITADVTNPTVAEQIARLEEDTAAAHLAAIAEMHAAALVQIASVAESWLRSAPTLQPTAPATGQIAAPVKPPVHAGVSAAD